ncbi:MAG: hypothetical protein M1812_001476 [Candelaria pacifica]|nr:MAG: hypothetical protein M1812_001476 [Candelaria pacifica]
MRPRRVEYHGLRHRFESTKRSLRSRVVGWRQRSERSVRRKARRVLHSLQQASYRQSWRRSQGSSVFLYPNIFGGTLSLLSLDVPILTGTAPQELHGEADPLPELGVGACVAELIATVPTTSRLRSEFAASALDSSVSAPRLPSLVIQPFSQSIQDEPIFSELVITPPPSLPVNFGPVQSSIQLNGSTARDRTSGHELWLSDQTSSPQIASASAAYHERHAGESGSAAHPTVLIPGSPVVDMVSYEHANRANSMGTTVETSHPVNLTPELANNADPQDHTFSNQGFAVDEYLRPNDLDKPLPPLPALPQGQYRFPFALHFLDPRNKRDHYLFYILCATDSQDNGVQIAGPSCLQADYLVYVPHKIRKLGDTKAETYVRGLMNRVRAKNKGLHFEIFGYAREKSRSSTDSAIEGWNKRNLPDSVGSLPSGHGVVGHEEDRADVPRKSRRNAILVQGEGLEFVNDAFRGFAEEHAHADAEEEDRAGR